MRETKTKEELYKLATESKDLLMSSDETKVREKVMWLDSFFNELEYSLMNLYSDPRTTFIYTDIIDFRTNILRPYFQNIEAEAAGINKPILIYKREIARFEYNFKSPMFSHIGEPFYKFEGVLTVHNNKHNHLVLVRRILRCDFEKDWRTTENHLLFSFFINMAFLIGLYKRLDKKENELPREMKHRTKTLSKEAKIKTKFNFFKLDNPLLLEMDLKKEFSKQNNIPLSSLYRYLKTSDL